MGPRVPAGSGGGRRVHSVEGNALRGSGPAGAQAHLLAVLDQHTGTVLGQVDVDGRANELTRFQPLLRPPGYPAEALALTIGIPPWTAWTCPRPRNSSAASAGRMAATAIVAPGPVLVTSTPPAA